MKKGIENHLVSLNVFLANKPMKAPIQKFLFSSFGFLSLHPYSSFQADADSPVKSLLLILKEVDFLFVTGHAYCPVAEL